MESNCSRYPLKPLDPSLDPAYSDGVPPRPRRPNHAGEIATAPPAPWIPPLLQRLRTISIEALEDEIEREAKREERYA
jgi:hypothetical protein